MKIAIYGISRSGKDYFINDFIKSYNHSNNVSTTFYHVSGSKLLREIALEEYKKEFDFLSELEKVKVRKKFISKVGDIEKEKGSIIVDGHYSFYDDNMNLYKVFTEFDLSFYDYYFYLDTNSVDVIERMKLSENEKKKSYSIEDINRWKDYEIENMSNDLLILDKELHVIKYDDNLALDYVLGVINGIYDSKKIAPKLLNNINFDGYESVILTDCDKTLSCEDTTELSLKLLCKDNSKLKEIYQGDRYTNYQALSAKIYLGDSFDKISMENINEIRKNITFNKNLIEDLKTKRNAKILAITAGLSNLWEKLLNMEGLKVEVLKTDLIMSKYIKYYVLRQIQKMGKYVIAIGDSILDSLMLRFANKSYIISNKGLRDNIKKLLYSYPRIHQLEYSLYHYDGIQTDSLIDSIKTILPITDEISKYISICKSDSGIDGVKLRMAHYMLGGEVAKLIEADYPKSKFVVVIMMRSGLCFGQGIADYFDCQELFYTESLADKFEKELEGNSNYKSKCIILVDGVINSGNSMKEIVSRMKGYKIIIATNVISSKFSVDYIHPIYATRISGRSFVGAKQYKISDGKGPDTSDRLFKNM